MNQTWKSIQLEFSCKTTRPDCQQASIFVCSVNELEFALFTFIFQEVINEQDDKQTVYERSPTLVCPQSSTKERRRTIHFGSKCFLSSALATMLALLKKVATKKLFIGTALFFWFWVFIFWEHTSCVCVCVCLCLVYPWTQSKCDHPLFVLMTNFVFLIQKITEDMRLGSSSRASCLACHALTALYLSPFYSKEAMVSAARSVCISFRLQPARVCTGLIDSFKVSDMFPTLFEFSFQVVNPEVWPNDSTWSCSVYSGCVCVSTLWLFSGKWFSIIEKVNWCFCL